MSAVASSKLRLMLVISMLACVLTMGAAGHYLGSTAPSQKKPRGNPDNPENPDYKQILPYVKQLSKLKPTHPAPADITTTIFMFRGDFSSPLFDLFTLQKRATKFCDKDTKAEGCD
ncbi:hypothetical protein EV179_006509, partial [Coemansia sp. RSA 487]